MASRAASLLARLASRSRVSGSSLLSRSPATSAFESFFPRPLFSAPSAIGRCSGLGELARGLRLTSLESPARPKADFAVRPFWTVDFKAEGRGLGGVLKSVSDRRPVAGTVRQQVRGIMVEVKGNDLDRAIRKWRRKCKEENLRALKDREYFRKPSELKVLAVKERDRRIAKRAFRRKLNWIMTRRQRGF